MVYISKKRGIKDFFKTRNMKYYIAFMILFLAVIATIIIVSKRIRPDGRSDAARLIPNRILNHTMSRLRLQEVCTE